ncbi:MAG: hypothetical protein LBV08_01735, partial [Clostridiales bacterium]|nr:hypothetical protein [Clostridiales bacterium]
NELLKNQLTEIVMPSTAASDAPISQNTDTPTYLVDLDWFDMDGEIVYVDETQNGTKDNLGNTYKNAICSNSRFTGFIIYKLDGKYSSFEGDFYQIYAKRSSDYKTTMVISVDDQVRFDETVTGGIDPIPILPIDVTGASELKISFSSSFNFAAYGALGDPKLY